MLLEVEVRLVDLNSNKGKLSHRKNISQCVVLNLQIVKIQIRFLYREFLLFSLLYFRTLNRTMGGIGRRIAVLLDYLPLSAKVSEAP